MRTHRMLDRRMIEVRGFKWPHRPTAAAMAYLLDEDAFGIWLGIARGNPWWAADGSCSGVFEMSFVKVVPRGTFWTACFNPVDPVIDVDIVLPVRWGDAALDEIDLELDILRSADGNVRVRDREEFDRVLEAWAMPGSVVAQAEETCAWVRTMVELGAEPFGNVGSKCLSRFLAEVSDAVHS